MDFDGDCAERCQGTDRRRPRDGGCFGLTLIGELQKAIAAAGPVNAIGVCHLAAPKIAAEKSAEKKMSIGRTSLKLRRPKNTPDGWEMLQLQRFEQRKAAGENPASIEFGEYVDVGGKKVFRYMKAILTADVCLNCHGTNLIPRRASRPVTCAALSPSCRARERRA